MGGRRADPRLGARLHDPQGRHDLRPRRPPHRPPQPHRADTAGVRDGRIPREAPSGPSRSTTSPTSSSARSTGGCRVRPSPSSAPSSCCCRRRYGGWHPFSAVGWSWCRGRSDSRACQLPGSSVCDDPAKVPSVLASHKRPVSRACCRATGSVTRDGCQHNGYCSGAGHNPTDCRNSVASAVSVNSSRLPTLSRSTSRTSAGLAKKNSLRVLARFSARAAKRL